MKRFYDDDGAQMILIACVSIVLALVLIAIYESQTLVTGENSIKSENSDSFYFYMDMRDKYSDIYNDARYLDYASPNNLSIFEKELKEFSLFHGYSLDFIHNNGKTTIIFVDKDIRIKEELS